MDGSMLRSQKIYIKELVNQNRWLDVILGFAEFGKVMY